MCQNGYNYVGTIFDIFTTPSFATETGKNAEKKFQK